jgi:hypothetical protein
VSRDEARDMKDAEIMLADPAFRAFADQLPDFPV